MVQQKSDTFMTATVLYFHGYQSSCQTEKFARSQAFFARQGVEVLGMELDYANLLLSDIDAMVDGCFARHHIVGCVGCSMGGYWANRSAMRHHVAAAIVNPAVDVNHVMRHPELAMYRNAELFASNVGVPRVVYLGTGDEVLDYRVALQLFPHEEVVLVDGGSHAGYEFLDAFLQDAWQVVSSQKA